VRRPVVRLGVAVESEQQAGAYLRRMRMARPMRATMSCATLTQGKPGGKPGKTGDRRNVPHRFQRSSLTTPLRR